MKNSCYVVLATIFFFVCTTAYEETQVFASASEHTVALVIVGDAEYKTQDFSQYAQKKLHGKRGNDCEIVAGDDIQSEYLEYWIEKGFLLEQPLREEDFTEFVKRIGFNQVIFLVIGNENVDKTPIRYAWGDVPYVAEDMTDGSVEAFAVFCDKDEVISTLDLRKKVTLSKGLEHTWKDNLFEKCIKEIVKEWYQLL